MQKEVWKDRCEARTFPYSEEKGGGTDILDAEGWICSLQNKRTNSDGKGQKKKKGVQEGLCRTVSERD